MQLWRLSADDIDFSSPCPVHAFCDEAGTFGVTVPTALPDNYGTTLPATTRYQTVQGWDYFTGYGRSNAARLLAYLGRRDHEHTGGHYGIGNSDLDGPGPHPARGRHHLAAMVAAVRLRRRRPASCCCPTTRPPRTSSWSTGARPPTA